MNATITFHEQDYAEAKTLFFDRLPIDSLTVPERSDTLHADLSHPIITVDLLKVAIPTVAGLLALWLGKGKTVTVQRGDAHLSLRNLSEPAAQAILKLFLSLPDA